MLFRSRARRDICEDPCSSEVPAVPASSHASLESQPENLEPGREADPCQFQASPYIMIPNLFFFLFFFLSQIRTSGARRQRRLERWMRALSSLGGGCGRAGWVVNGALTRCGSSELGYVSLLAQAMFSSSRSLAMGF